MTQEDKELLLKKDLCARLPYGVKLEIKYQNGAWMLFAIYYSWNKIYVIGDGGYPIETNFTDCKPYLFPLSSMTEEQQINLTKFVANGIHGENILYDWLNKNHFDYRGLIEKGLAIDVTNLNIYDKKHNHKL